MTGANRQLLTSHGRVLDMGSRDGELAFSSSLGYQVVAADHPAYNHNGMRGIRALKAAGRGWITRSTWTAVHAAARSYDLVVFLGILYHLRNPFYVLEGFRAVPRIAW